MDSWIIVCIVVIVILIVSQVRTTKMFREQVNCLTENGFTVDYQMAGRPYFLLVDKTQKKLAFVSTHKSLVFSYNEILNWKHTFTEQNKTVNGVHKYSLIDNKIEFTTNNPDMPLIVVSVGSHAFAKEWSARFSALFNC